MGKNKNNGRQKNIITDKLDQFAELVEAYMDITEVDVTADTVDIEYRSAYDSFETADEKDAFMYGAVAVLYGAGGKRLRSRLNIWRCNRALKKVA